MHAEQNKVREFHDKHAYPTSPFPTLVEASLWQQRHKFILEELGEYWAACEDGDLVGIADALGDLAYVILGTAVVHGIDLRPVFDEIHRSNMTKTPLDPVTRKGGKGEGYEPPALLKIILEQIAAKKVA